MIPWIGDQWRRVRDRWVRLWEHWHRWLAVFRHVHLDPEYREAHVFKDAFEPKKDANYTWVVDYARQNYDRLDKADQTLDAKAESIINVFGGGTGLLTLGAIANLVNLTLPTTICLIIAVLLALVAICFAAWVRVPRHAYMPPSIGWALAYVEAYDKDAENKFLGQWHLACEGMRLAVRSKARGVTVSSWFAVAAVAALAVTLLTAIVTKDTKEGSTQMGSNQNAPSGPPPAPNPSGVPQTPPPQTSLPAIQAGPQTLQKSMLSEPAKAAEPQSIQFSRD